MTAVSVEKVNGTPVASPEPRFDPVALAEAEAIRTRAAADAEAARIKAEGEAEAEKVKAVEETRKQKIANDRAEARAREEQAAREARIAELNRKQAADARAQREETERAERDKRAEQQSQEKAEQTEDSWRFFAIAFAVMCGVVALPVQMAAFWNEKAPWMISAPFMLEGAAWVVLRGAAAAVAAHRPHWHFRLIAWVLAFVAAGVNLWHGLIAFDPATAIGTAVASIAGPGVWDLYEHGRIRKRDGVPTRRERKAAEKAAKEEARQKAAEEKQRAADKKAADEVAAEAAKQLAESREAMFPEVWKHALRIAAALGEATVTEAVWKRAHRDVEGADPAESADIITGRRKAEKRVEAARSGGPVSAVSKTKNTQRAIQTPRSSYKPVPPRRKAGDTPRYSRAAGRAHGDLLRRRQAANNSRPNDN
ncbi:hypothetical protein ACJ6WF_17050 [Streptomyces sp. MMS24-I2-30]|uniref:hypothetical protein n=1 Tax=Streptomyces sp. MMS24-I2-30 TaxID=3351564 RepID=UPI003896E235